VISDAKSSEARLNLPVEIAKMAGAGAIIIHFARTAMIIAPAISCGSL